MDARPLTREEAIELLRREALNPGDLVMCKEYGEENCSDCWDEFLEGDAAEYDCPHWVQVWLEDVEDNDELVTFQLWSYQKEVVCVKN